MPTDPKAPLSFDIIGDEWLDVLRTNGTIATLSLRELLVTAHDIARLSEPSPLTEVALLRFLIALVSDGLRDQIPSEEDWAPFVDGCRDGLSAQAINSILAPLEGCSNILDPNHDAFFDGPAIRDGRHTGCIYPGKDEGSAPTDVLLSIPTGTEIGHFHRVVEPASICVRCLLKGTLTKSLFATAVNSEFQELVRPPGELPAFITDLTGITPSMLDGARSAAVVLEDFLSWAPSGATFVAHNVGFDLAVIRNETAHWSEFSSRLFVDSLPIARTMNEFPDNRLETIATCCGYSERRCHRALDDAWIVSQLMSRALSRGHVEKYRELFAGAPAQKLLGGICEQAALKHG
jgi:DNA polymerase III epsilon subunit-like protein